MQQDVQALLDVFFAAGVAEAAGGVGQDGEPPAGAEEFARSYAPSPPPRGRGSHRRSAASVGPAPTVWKWELNSGHQLVTEHGRRWAPSPRLIDCVHVSVRGLT